jgi:hypothetical protein
MLAVAATDAAREYGFFGLQRCELVHALLKIEPNVAFTSIPVLLPGIARST